MHRRSLFASGLIVTTLLIGLSFAQDRSSHSNSTMSSLSERLQGFKHVSLNLDEKSGDYLLSLFTVEQHQRNLKMGAERFEKETEMRRLRAEFQDAEKRNDAEKQANIRKEVEKYKTNSGALNSDSLLQLYDVVGLGTDYLELRRSEPEGPHSSILIPFAQIRSIKTAPAQSE